MPDLQHLIVACLVVFTLGFLLGPLDVPPQTLLLIVLLLSVLTLALAFALWWKT